MQGVVSADGRVLTVSLPLRLRKRGGRKRVVAPDGVLSCMPSRARVDGTLVKALARAHCWRGLLESGAYGSIAELAAAEQINPSYLARVLRLTLLAPDIVEAVLDGRHDPEQITLANLMRQFPMIWQQQLSGGPLR